LRNRLIFFFFFLMHGNIWFHYQPTAVWQPRAVMGSAHSRQVFQSSQCGVQKTVYPRSCLEGASSSAAANHYSVSLTSPLRTVPVTVFPPVADDSKLQPFTSAPVSLPPTLAEESLLSEASFCNLDQGLQFLSRHPPEPAPLEAYNPEM
jgi:hypothetical protein